MMDSYLGGLGERFIRWIFEGPLGVISRFMRHEYNVVDLVYKRAVERSAVIAEVAFSTAIISRSKQELWDLASNKAKAVNGMWMEFGVFRGTSINYISKYCDVIYGFDSFEGLAEDWSGNSLTKGAFNLKGALPSVRKNVILIPGFFNAVLPSFIKSHAVKQVSFLHLDCDTYDSTIYVLETLDDYILPGTIIVFDDYFGAPSFELGQFRALEEYRRNTQKNIKCISYSRQSIAVIIE